MTRKTHIPRELYTARMERDYMTEHLPCDQRAQADTWPLGINPDVLVVVACMVLAPIACFVVAVL